MELSSDLIYIYLSDKFEQIGVEPPDLVTIYDQESDNGSFTTQTPVTCQFLEWYLFADEGSLLQDLYQILSWMEQEDVPEDVLEELKNQINRFFDPVNVLHEMFVYKDVNRLDIFPDDFVFLFQQVHHFGYESQYNQSHQVGQIKEMFSFI